MTTQKGQSHEIFSYGSRKFTHFVRKFSTGPWGQKKKKKKDRIPPFGG